MEHVFTRDSMIEPWEHLIFMGIGATVGNYIVNANEENEKDVKTMIDYLERPQIKREN